MVLRIYEVLGSSKEKGGKRHHSSLSRFYTVNILEAPKTPKPEPLIVSLLTALVQHFPRAILLPESHKYFQKQMQLQGNVLKN